MDHPRTVAAEARIRVLAACSRQLAASDRHEDVQAALDGAIAELLPGRTAHVLRRTGDVWHAWTGGDATAAEVARADGLVGADAAALVAGCVPELDAVTDTGRPHHTHLRLRGPRVDVLLVPAGPASAPAVLALVSADPQRGDGSSGSEGQDEGPRDADRSGDQALLVLAAELWSALRRIEVTSELDHAVKSAQEAAEDFRLRDRHGADHVAGITHDLRSPVTAVLGFVRTLRKAGDLLTEDERREALEIIERQTLRMSRMLDDMLDSARAESGELVAGRRLAVPLHLVVREAIAAVGAEQRPRLRPHLDIDVTVCGDADQLARVVHNLLGNAVAYAAGSGPVDIGVHREGSNGVLTVVDRGPGIPADKDVFARYGAGDVRGTGLGLYTVKRIVELHDGTITVSTTPGGGTTVTVRVPCFDPDASA